MSLNVRFLPRWGVLLGLMVLTFGLTVGCQAGTVSQATNEDCTPVDSLVGTVCIPQHFERLVTLDSVSFEYAIATGLQPIGTVQSNFQTALTDLKTKATDIGTNGEPSLEKILALRPDLIVGLDFNQGIYPQLAQIAPTLLVPFEHSGQWKAVFEQVGEALNETVAVEKSMAAYYDRAADFRAQMGNRLENLQVSVIRLYPDTINLYLKDSFCGTVLQDAGLARPPAQDISANEADQRFGNAIQISISRELLAQADGDVMFLWTGENSVEDNQRAQQNLQSLQQDPLWQKLKVVQAGRVYQVPSYWIGSGPVAANAILDDLFKFLLEEA